MMTYSDEIMCEIICIILDNRKWDISGFCCCCCWGGIEREERKGEEQGRGREGDGERV